MHDDAALALVWRGTAAFALITVFLLMLTAALRGGLIVREKRRTRFLATWRPLLMQALIELPPLPPVERPDWPTFMALWNHMQASLRGEAREALNEVGRRVGLPEAAYKAIRRGPPRRVPGAILALGNLGELSAWNDLAPLALSASPYVSLAAMRALVQLDARRAAPILAQEVVRRDNWAPTNVVAILKELPPALYSHDLVQVLAAAPVADAVRALKLLVVLPLEGFSGVVPVLLGRGDQPDLLAAALPLAGPTDLPRVRELLADPTWFVRVQAATALGRLGLPGDDALLRAALEDPAWWVRYRAAGALAKLPFVGPGPLAALAESHPDERAREVLVHVLAEAAA